MECASGRRASLGVVALMLVPVAPAQAAEADEAIVVTASRSGTGVRADQLGASVTVLDAEALALRQTRVVSDALRDVPGVAVSRTGTIGGLTQVRIRGTEANHVLVLIDGIEVADPYLGEYDFGTLIADPQARIEVLRGQQSALYGSDAIGGVIHYLTLNGAEAPGVSLRGEAGSFETFTGAARAAGVSGDLDYAVSGTYLHSGGTPTARGGTRDVGSDSFGASAKLIWSPSKTFTLTGVGRYSHTRADQNNGDNDPASPTFGLTIDSPGTYYRNRGFYGLVSAELLGLEGRWTNRLTGQIADTRRKGYEADARISGDDGERLKGSFVSSLRLGDDRVVHRLTGAIDVERESFRNTAPGTGSPFDAFNGERHTDNVGIVGQYELLIGDAVSFGASLRRDENNRFDDTTTYRVQGSYRLPFGTRLRGAWGTGVKNPGYFELYGFSDGRYIGNPNLKPEKSEGWEVGVEQELVEGRALIGATYFDSRLEDEIFTDFPPPDFVATPGNLDTRSHQHGVELFASARPIPQLRFDAAYTYLKASENGATEVRRPRHVASFNATAFSRDERFSGTLTLRYNGRQSDVAFTDPSFAPVAVSLAEYVLVNVAAEYRLRPNVSLIGRVENLLDEDYEEVFSFATPGIGATAGVSVRF